MATQFLQSYFDGMQYVLTSDISSLRASTDKKRIDVSMTCDNGLDGCIETFYASSLYAFDNVVELPDAGSLIEEYFRLRNKVIDTVTIVFDDISVDVNCLYCEYAMPEGFNPENSFFIAAAAQRVHQDSTVAIAAVSRGDSVPFAIKAVGHSLSDGGLCAVEKSVVQPFNQECTTYFRVADVIQLALDNSDNSTAEPLRDVLYFSIDYAGIQKMCFIVPAPAYLTFSFRNAFNVEESLDVVGVMTTKTEVSRDVVVCGGHSIQYDRAIARTYQVQTEPLPQEEVCIFEQFLASHRVSLRLDDYECDIIIADHTCEPSSDDESLATVKFTWRFAGQRPRIFASLMDGTMPSRRKIFDDTFSPEYE